MIGILLLFFIGKHFYNLAKEHNKSKGLFAFLGIVAYYVGTFIFGIILVLILEIFNPGYIDTMDDVSINLLSLPFGILSVYIFYKIIENDWKKKKEFREQETLDANFIELE